MSKTKIQSKIGHDFHFLEKIKKISKKISSDKNLLTLIYKLLHDVLFILLFSLTMILIAEGLIPGIATSHLSLARVTIFLVATIFGIVLIGKKLGHDYQKTRLNKSKLLPILITISFLLIGNSLLRFEFWENIIITVLTLLVFIIFYHLLFSGKE